MKTLRFFLLVLAASVALCNAQEFTEAGWFNATGFIDDNASYTNAPPDENGGSELSAQGATSIAEANTPEIQALAQGLENDPKRIFDFVHDHIRHVLYFGSKKGAQLTLLERSGNDFDQCALLVALLRAANPNQSATYRFGVLKMPYDSSDHKDLHHWLGLSLVNTNWLNTSNQFRYMLVSRGYPTNALFTFTGDTNTFGFQRVWVKLSIGSTNYYLDPAFKVSEPITNIDLPSAMGLSTNDLVTAASAGSTSTADYVKSLNEAALRNKLRDYTTNLLGTIQSSYPNASVEQIIGGQQVVPSTDSVLSQSLLFPSDTSQLPIADWDDQPTNLMSRFSVTFANTNYQWFMPSLQGQRLALTFNSNGVAELWKEDASLLQKQTTGTSSRVSVTLSVNHPYGAWNFTINAPIDTGKSDQSDSSASYQRTNATYALIYAFDTSEDELRRRQEKLDSYRQRYADDSRQVLSETLNVVGLKWLLQTELVHRLSDTQWDMQSTYHHRFGRMAQEAGQGYYADIYLQVSALLSSAGSDTNNQQRLKRSFDVIAYFASACEHAIIEQMQSSNLVAASTVKMLQLANTNGLKIFLANSNNWAVNANVSSQLTNYNLAIWSNYARLGFNLLMPQNGSQRVAGAGTWAGYGVVLRFEVGNVLASGMLIDGNYHGGYVSDPFSFIDTPYIYQFSYVQPTKFTFSSPYQPVTFGADPVNLADGAFTMNETDLTVGQSEPRGFTFARHYSPTRRYHNLAGLAHGWVHNYYFDVSEVSAPEAGMGQTTPAQAAPMIVATRAALELYNTQPDAKNWVLTALIAKWGIDQLINNAVSVTLGRDTIQFIKQPDGSFTPPASSTMTLAKTNSAYTLQERHGNTFKFDANKRLTNIVDQYNQGLKLSYNSSNWVTTAKDWKDRTLTLTYTGNPSRLTSVSDGTRSVSYGYATTYNTNGDLVSISDPEQKTNTFIYDTSHKIIATKNALGQVVTTNVYDDFGRVITQYSQGYTTQAWQFYWSGFVNTEQDPSDSKRRFFYDDKHRLTSLQDALGNTSRTFYDGQDHVVMTASPLNETNRFEFDRRHNLLRSIDPLGYTNQFFYDAQDHLTNSVDARGNASYFGYNAQHSLTGSTNGAGDWTAYVYNTDGTLATNVTPGGATGYGYDSTYGQLNSITYPGSLGSESFVSDARGDVTNHTNARGFVTSFQFNNRRELTNTVAPTNLTARVAYDAVGNVLTTTDPRGFSASNTWSATRKLLATTLSVPGVGVTNIYDNRDWLLRTLNPQLSTLNYTNDAAGRLIAVTDPLSRTIKSSYDADGRKTGTTNAALEVTKQQWNARGEQTNLINAASNAVGRVYDAAGNQIFLTNRNGKRWQFQFDAANRLTNTVTPMNRTNSQSWNDRGLLASVKEPSGDTATLSYDAKGRLTNRTDSLGAITYRYDANNNVTNIVESGKTNAWTFDAYDRASTYRDADGNLIQYRYDQNGNLTNLIYPGSRAVAYAYDSLNRLTNVTDWANRKTTFTYDLASRVTGITRPNGTVREIKYDVAGQTTNIVERLTNNFPIAFFRFNWNAAARADWEFAAPLPHAYTPASRTMVFDDDNRLKTFNTQNVTNDSDGNMTWGPLTNDTLTAYVYDARNRLLNAGGLDYAYDPAGNRTSTASGTNVTRFVVNPNAALSQVLMRVKGGTTNYYIYGLGLLYEITETAASTNTLSYHYDYRGSTVALTRDDGMPTDRMEYSAYGTITYRSGTNDTPFLFNGRYGVQTDANGLLYMRARYYNPYLCRFLNPDPAGFSGGLNFYAYADGNPISFLDPFGLGAGGENFWSWLGSGARGAIQNDLNKYYGQAQGVLDAGTTLVGGVVGFLGQQDIVGKLLGVYGWADKQVSAINGQLQSGLDSVAQKVGADNNNYTFVLNALGAEASAYIATTLVGGRGGSAASGADELVTVTRWQTPPAETLQSGNWVVEGSKNVWNYLMSGKYNPLRSEYHVPYENGRSFVVPSSTLEPPGGLEGLKALPPLNQRRYYPIPKE